MVPPLSRIDSMRELIDKQSYFVVHAPRQAGKTTTMVELARVLTEEGRYAAVLVSMLAGSTFHEIGAAEEAILHSWRDSTQMDVAPSLTPPDWPAAPPGSRISSALHTWARHCQRPLVVFLDEIDSLQNDVLLSVLRQLHAHYRLRPKVFPRRLR